MAYFEWDNSYSVGVASLDAQHQELIRLINRLHAIEQGGGDLTPVLDRLDWYVRHHFSFEEALMRSAGYRGFDAHVVEHRAFEAWLRGGRFAMRAGAGAARDIASIINDYLKDWLRKHIQVVDMDYKPVLTAAGSRGKSIGVLADHLVATLEDARGKGTNAAIDRAIALARDIKLCAGTGDDLA